MLVIHDSVSGAAANTSSRPSANQSANPSVKSAASGFRLIYKDPNRPIVAVSGLHRGENPQPGSAVIAALRRVYPRLRVVGLAYDSLESGL